MTLTETPMMKDVVRDGSFPATLRTGSLSWALPIVLALAAVVPFLPTLGGQFLRWDDDENFVNNLDFGNLSWSGIRWAWVTFRGAVYQPLGWILLETEHSFWGMNPKGYHAASLALHAANAIALYYLVVALLDRALTDEVRRDGLAVHAGAAGAAALFAMHPLRVEVVAWISCQTYLPSILLSMLTVLAYLRANPPGGPSQPRWTVTAWLLSFAAMLFKAAAVSLPVVLVILDVYPLGRLGHGRWLDRRVWREKLWFFGPATVFMALAVRARAYYLHRLGQGDFGLEERISVAFYGVWFYLAKTVWPFRLSPSYERSQSVRFFDWPFWGAALAALCVSVALIILFHGRRRGPLVAWLAYVVILGPHLGLVSNGGYLAADRYCYMASIPLFVLAGWGLCRTIRAVRGRPVAAAFLAAVGVGLLLGLGSLTWVQSRTWGDSISFWTHALALSDHRNAGIIGNLGNAMIDAGKIDEGEALLRRALSADPTSPNIHYNLGLLMQVRRNDAEAEAHFAEAVRAFTPHTLPSANAHFKLGLLLGRRGRHNEALFHFYRAQEIRPDDPDLQDNIGTALLRMGRFVEAERHFLRALKLRPGFALARQKLVIARQAIRAGAAPTAPRQYPRSGRVWGS
jgi:Tfp pilus assembly protein PilF